MPYHVLAYTAGTGSVLTGDYQIVAGSRTGYNGNVGGVETATGFFRGAPPHYSAGNFNTGSAPWGSIDVDTFNSQNIVAIFTTPTELTISLAPDGLADDDTVFQSIEWVGVGTFLRSARDVYTSSGSDGHTSWTWTTGNPTPMVDSQTYYFNINHA